MASFTVVAMVRTDRATLSLFARYYEAAGAERIRVFFDGPAEEVPDVAVPGLEVVVLDAAFWDALGTARPEMVEIRQRTVYAHAYAQLATEWMLVVDHDEFVFGDRPLGAYLDTVPSAVPAVNFRTAEAVFGPGDDAETPFAATHFRRALHPRVWAALGPMLYGRTRMLMRLGLAGHVQGKSALRRGLDGIVIRLHNPLRDDARISVPSPEVGSEGRAMWVAHYDAIDYAGWADKWRHRIAHATDYERMSAERRAAQEAAREAFGGGEAAARRLFRRLYGLDTVQRALLGAAGGVWRADPLAGVRAAARGA